LLGDDADVGSCDALAVSDVDDAVNLLERRLPEMIDADTFIDDIIGLTTCGRGGGGADTSSADARRATTPRPRTSDLRQSSA